MKKLLIAVGLTIAAFIYIIYNGGTYNAEIKPYYRQAFSGELTAAIEEGEGVISVENLREEKGVIKYTVHAVTKGRAEILIQYGDYTTFVTYYVNSLGVVTESSHLGKSTGGNLIIVLVAVYAAIMLGSFINKFRKGLKNDFYDYHNITLLGVCIFIGCIILYFAAYMFTKQALLDSLRGLVAVAGSLAYIALPIALLTTVLVFISNLSLIKHEGKNKKNLLGTFFSVLFFLILLFPHFLEEWLQRQSIIDVHKESGWGNYFDMVVTNSVYVIVAYLFVILLATVIMGIAASHRKLAFDKDYILILGCRVRKDGTPTPLLKGRADAALKFAENQKQATGNELIFVPSGGQGKDEAVSEAECIKNYLLSCGINENRILVEDKSKNT